MIGLFGRILSLLWVSFAKETYHFKEPTNRSHPIRGVRMRGIRHSRGVSIRGCSGEGLKLEVET